MLRTLTIQNYCDISHLDLEFIDKGGRLPTENEILQKLERRTVRLLELPAEMNRGSSTGLDQVFVLDAETECDTLEAGILRTPLFASSNV